MDLSIAWAGVHPLGRPERTGVLWAIAPLHDEPETYAWSSHVGLSGLWSPFGWARLTVQPHAAYYRPDSEEGLRAWLGSQAWWENVYSSVLDPLAAPLLAAHITERMATLYRSHEAWRDTSYALLPEAMSAGGVRALGREVLARWNRYGESVASLCQAQAIRYADVGLSCS